MGQYISAIFPFDDEDNIMCPICKQNNEINKNSERKSDYDGEMVIISDKHCKCKECDTIFEIKSLIKDKRIKG